MKQFHLIIALVVCVGCGTTSTPTNAAEVDEVPMDAFAGRSYYTTERNAILVWQEPPNQTATPKLASVRTESGKILASAVDPGETRRIEVPIANLPNGIHQLNLELTWSGRDPLKFPVELIKRSPKPGFEWKIDRINRVMLKEGEPYFPFGMIMYGMVAPRDAESFELVSKRFKMNSIVRWYNGDPELALDYHEMAAENGLQVIETMDRFSKNNLTSAKLSPNFDPLVAKNLPRIRRGIEKVRNQRSLMAWNNLDEPFKGQIAAGRQLYSMNRDLDGYHPTFVLYSSFIPPGDEYIDWCDILGVDPYWTPAGHGVRGNVNYVSKTVALCRQRADTAQKVTWIVPMAELYSGIRKRPLLRREQFCQSYLSLIHGAKGLIYFRYPVMHQKSIATLEALGDQFKVLGPIAVTPEIEQTIDYSPARFDPKNNKFPDVQVSLKRKPSGGSVLLAANTRPFPVDVSFRVSLLKNEGSVTQLFRPENHTVKDSSFGETIEPLGTRAYVLSDAAVGQLPVQITVQTQPQPNQADPRYAAGVPDSGRPGKKNLLANPGFEMASFPNWPDYYLFNPMRPHGQAAAQGHYGLDPKEFFEGKTSLWMESDGKRKARFYSACSPKLTEPKRYTLSGWMRADRDGVKVRFVGFGYRVPKPTFGATEFTLTTDWQRYSELGTLPPSLPNWHSVGVEIVDEKPAKVWFDALQLEAGEATTTYDP